MEVSEVDDLNKRATKLELLLGVCKGADMWLMPALKSQVENRILAGGRLFINLQNVLEVRERAGDANAQAVEQMCTLFI